MGIMTIELADKNPPLSDIHPMRALYLIPAADEKTLNVQQPKKWSKPLLDFIRYCLNKDPVSGIRGSPRGWKWNWIMAFEQRVW